MADAGEISYINLNGEIRKIAGSDNTQISNTIQVQENKILKLEEEAKALRQELLETQRGFASLVQGLTSGSVIEQTDTGFSVTINKVQYSLVLSPRKDNNQNYLDMILFADGKEVTEGTFYIKIYSTGEGGVLVQQNQSEQIISEGKATYPYTNFKNDFTVLVYDSVLYDKMICSATITLAEDGESIVPQGVYSIELSTNKGYVRNSTDTEDVVVSAFLYRNGVNVHNKVMTFSPFLYSLSWYSPKDGAKTVKSSTGQFVIKVDDIDNKTTFSCSVDIPIDEIESAVTF